MIKGEEYKGKKVTIMGLGLNSGGVGTVRFFSSLGAKIIVTDMKSQEELASSLEKLKDLKNIEYVFGQHRSEDFTNTDLVVKTPGVPWNNKYVMLAKNKNIPVEIDASLFFKFCQNPIIGITGTKGKTTTATLIYEILKTAGKNPLKVGIGQVSVMDKIAEIKKDSIIVFELSSWRLSALGKFKLSPKIAVLTNIYPDHLNYYSSMESYVQDKKYIFLNQNPNEFCVLNWDNKILNKLESDIKSQMIKFSKNKITTSKAVYIENNSIYLSDGIDEKRVIDISDIKIKGKHNLENIMAAIGAGYAAGAGLKEIKKAIVEFRGVQHRLEFVRDFSGVRYYNDTAATTPESAIAGISSFSEPIILLAGGADKKLNMRELAETIIEKVKKVIFFKGVATDKIIKAIKEKYPQKAEIEFLVVDSMKAAVNLARDIAEVGDVVLLSPGAASFGLFQNEFDRGNQFKEIVNKM